ncbi:MAG: phenylalanine--tRNA ligase subunit alpha [bacterium]
MTPEQWLRQIACVKNDFLNSAPRSASLEELDSIKVQCLGRKGALTELLKLLKDFTIEERRELGPAGNSLKEELTSLIDKKHAELSRLSIDAELCGVRLDLTLPASPLPEGRLHPLTLTMQRMTQVLSGLGFIRAEGPLIETEYHNFEALNIPADHPSRDMHDTFYLKAGDSGGKPLLLRTHTSPVQIRRMEKTSPPLRIMAPGRVFRHEAVDAGHSAVFHQLEGFYVNRLVSMADLKGTLLNFMRGLFGPEAAVRFRPSYFPFVEPGAEVDLRCVFCRGCPASRQTPSPCRGSASKCPVCKGTGWLEMLGAGIIHPNVLKTVGYDPGLWSGFAFGVGVERVAMLLYGISDIRTFYENDLRVLEQF